MGFASTEGKKHCPIYHIPHCNKFVLIFSLLQLEKLEDDDVLQIQYQSLLKVLKIGENDIEVSFILSFGCMSFGQLIGVY